MKQLPQAADYARRAWQLCAHGGAAAAQQPPWSDDLLAWHVRAALRQPASDDAAAGRWCARPSTRWRRPSSATPPGSTGRPARTRPWPPPGADGDAGRAARAARRWSASRRSSASTASWPPKTWAGSVVLPPPPAPLTADERDAARANRRPGARAAADRAWACAAKACANGTSRCAAWATAQLLAAAQWACDREVWDRCINTSDRTRDEIDLAQRFPMPFRDAGAARRRARAGLDPA